MTNKTSILILLICVAPIYLIAQSFDATIGELSDDIAKKISSKGKRNVAVWDFSDNDGNVTNLGKFLSEEISVNLTNSAQPISVMDRNHLNTILREHKLNAEGFIDVNTAKELGKITAVDAIVTGTITVFGDKIRLTIKVLDTETALIVAASKGDLPISKDVASFIGVPDLGPAGMSDANRGFNRPMNSNERYNNPKTVSQECETKNTGDFCFENRTSSQLTVSLFNKSDTYRYLPVASMSLSPGESQCAYNVAAKSYIYTVRHSSNKSVRSNGEVLIEKCKSKTFTIK